VTADNNDHPVVLHPTISGSTQSSLIVSNLFNTDMVIAVLGAVAQTEVISGKYTVLCRLVVMSLCR
jgi:hypothetical protein